MEIKGSEPLHESTDARRQNPIPCTSTEAVVKAGGGHSPSRSPALSTSPRSSTSTTCSQPDRWSRSDDSFGNNATALLHQDGFVVRNTFIDLPCVRGNCAQRSSSAPCKLSIKDDGDDDDDEPLDKPITRRRTLAVTMPPIELATALHALDASEFLDDSASVDQCHTDNAVGSGHTAFVEAGLDRTCVDVGKWIFGLLEEHCGFLRIRGYSLLSKLTANAEKQGAKGTLRVYIENLPFAKRTKWMSPFFKLVATFLDAEGCETKMKRCELYAPVRSDAALPLLRIDFMAHID